MSTAGAFTAGAFTVLFRVFSQKIWPEMFDNQLIFCFVSFTSWIHSSVKECTCVVLELAPLRGEKISSHAHEIGSWYLLVTVGFLFKISDKRSRPFCMGPPPPGLWRHICPDKSTLVCENEVDYVRHLGGMTYLSALKKRLKQSLEFIFLLSSRTVFFTAVEIHQVSSQLSTAVVFLSRRQITGKKVNLPCAWSLFKRALPSVWSLILMN